jgi:hypothetical protein
MKISFDYDGTLADFKIQELAKSFVAAGHDVWVLTSRFDDAAFDENGKVIGHYGHNMDIRRVCDRVGIPNDKVLFTNGKLKKDTYFKHNFDIHYDDLVEEVDAINENGGCAFLVYASYSEIIDQIKCY